MHLGFGIFTQQLEQRSFCFNSDSQSNLKKNHVSKLFPESCENNKQPIFKVWKAHVWKKNSSETQDFSRSKRKNLWIVHQATASTCWRHDLSSTTMDGISMQGHIHQVEANASIFGRFIISLGEFFTKLPSRRCSFLTVSAAWNIILMSFLFLRRNFPCPGKKNALDFT